VDLTSVGVPVEPGLAADEFIVVQGIADLVVVGAKELWLLDFKTDRLKKTELADKVTTYRPQVGLYALALSRIYGRPVTERWLHFLSLNRTVPL
jgi:ATP-dependent helicase/nuclease subunit A